MATIYRCDNCGDAVKPREVCALEIALPLTGGAKAPTVRDVMQGRDGGIDIEKFHLCPSCAMAICIALKDKRLKVRRGEAIIPM